MITFTKVNLPYGCFGNMSPHPIEWDGRTWRTSEALFQARRFTDTAIQEEIRAAKSPMTAKMIAKSRKAAMVIEPRSKEDLRLMYEILRLKVDQHESVLKELIATEDQDIVEDASNRPNDSGLFWGMARGPDGVWRGKNVLGKLWMKVRAEIASSALVKIL